MQVAFTMSKLNDFELNQIYTGDARVLAKGIPDESIDLIFADPVYDHIDDYAWLAQEATRILKPDKPLLCWYATSLKDVTIEAMKPFLRYRWDLSLFLPGPGGSVLNGIICKRTDCLWFEKGKSSTTFPIWDVQFGGSVPAGILNTHRWVKHLPAVERWILAFSNEDDIVFDPFCGGGTVPAVCRKVQRNYLAFEIDGDIAREARLWVEQFPVSRLLLQSHNPSNQRSRLTTHQLTFEDDYVTRRTQA